MAYSTCPHPTPPSTIGKTGEFTSLIAVDEPWEIEIPIEWLVPRFLQR